MSEVSQFTPPHPLNTAVLFLVFNRLDTTKQVFEAIRQAKPPRLYVAADGARSSKEGEAEKVQAVRDYIMQNIDWECEVKTLFRDQNLGCKYAVSGAITWFFENEEQGIILEDDCLPSQSFFWYCERMLNLYKQDNRIVMVTGTNYLIDIRTQVQEEYIYSRHFSIWGWATWKRAWITYDVELDDYRDDIVNMQDYLYMATSKYDLKFYKSIIDHVLAKNIDTWDFQWVLNCIYNYGLCVTPSVNLISNLGVEGAHAKGATKNNFMPVGEVKLERLNQCKRVVPNFYHDKNVSLRNFKVGYLHGFISTVKKLIVRIIK